MTGMSRHFTHLQTGEPVTDPRALDTVLLTEATNLGLAKMAQACPEYTITPAGLDRRLVCARRDVPSWTGIDLQRSASTPIRRSLGRRHHVVLGRPAVPGRWAECVDWPGQRPLRACAGREAVHPHLSDQYGPYHTTTISATGSEAPYLVDGLLYYEMDLEIAEHYSDTGAFTDQISASASCSTFVMRPRPRSLVLRKLAATHVKTGWPGVYARSAASTGRCSRSTGCRAGARASASKSSSGLLGHRDIRSMLGYAELQETQVLAGSFERGTMTIAACKRIPDSRRWPS